MTSLNLPVTATVMFVMIEYTGDLPFDRIEDIVNIRLIFKEFLCYVRNKTKGSTDKKIWDYPNS